MEAESTTPENDLTMCDETITVNKTEEMFKSAQAGDLETLKKLISEGADPLATGNSYDEQNLLDTLFNHSDFTSKQDTILPIIEYVINLPQYKELSERNKEVYYSLLYNMSWKIPCHSKDCIPMLNLISKVKNINTITFDTDIRLDCPENINIKVNSLALFVCSLIDFYDEGMFLIFRHVLNNTELSTYANDNCVTVLTVFIVQIWKYKLSGLETSETKKLVRVLIKRNVNVESCILNVSSLNPVKLISKFKWLVPDALILSFLFYLNDLVSIFLPYWWGPPLALVYFNTYHSEFTISNFTGRYVANFRNRPVKKDKFCLQSLPTLMSYGGIPHGTDMFRLVDEHMRVLFRDAQDSHDPREQEDAQKFLHLWPSYEQFTASPMRLTDLAKYAVRHSFAERAAQPDTNLPMLLKQNLPPLLYTVCTQQYQDLESEEEEEESELQSA